MNQNQLKAMHAAAMSYKQAGLSFVPICPDGSKVPLASFLPLAWCEEQQRDRPNWNVLRSRQPTDEEIARWYNPTICMMVFPPGLAIVGGAISGNLSVIDFDDIAFFEPWKQAILTRCPGLFEKLVLVQSPRPGMHVYYRSPAVDKCRPLASVLVQDDDGVERPKKIIELKAEGGLITAPPSPGECHPTGREYAVVQGTLTKIPSLSLVESMTLLDAATKLGTYHAPIRSAVPTTTQFKAGSPQTNRPGDVYAAQTSWHEILVPHGWTPVGPEANGLQYWRRPGKTIGTSATTGYAGKDLLHIFSESAEPFEGNENYGKFAAFAWLEHGGNFKDAARAIRSTSIRR